MYGSPTDRPPSMTLVSIPGNPIPAGAQELQVTTADKIQLRTVRWLPEGAARGTVTICQGRAEFIEKYLEVVGELLARGFAVVTFDWRGQGGSARQLRNKAKGHVADFKRFQRDLAALVRAVLKPFAPTPWYGLGHSMGAAILLEAAHDGILPFERLVLTGPMVDIAAATRPRGAALWAKSLVMSGMGTAFVPGGGAKVLQALPFAGNPLTSDQGRYARAKAVLAQAPGLAIGAPTVAWVHAAFQLFRRFAMPGYAEDIRVPTFIIGCGKEALVDTAAAERFAMRMKAGRYAVLPDTRHEIMMETDELRAQFWAAFDAFMRLDEPTAAPLRGARRDLAMNDSAVSDSGYSAMRDTAKANRGSGTVATA